MKIAFDHQIFSLQSHGGISRYITNLVNQFLLMDHDAKVFAPFHKNKHILDIPKSAVSGIFFERYPPKTTRLFLGLNQKIAAKMLDKWSPDVIHETYYSETRTCNRSSPLVITVHDMIHELFPSEMGSRDKTATKKLAAVERADLVICVSENTKKDLLNLYNINANKVCVVYLGCEKFSQEKNILSNKSGFKPYLLYVGNRGGYKNFTGLLQALRQSSRLMQDFDLICFGGGVFLKHERELIRYCGFNESQVRHIAGSDSALGQLYFNARAFIFPSKYEGFGIPPLEAMALNCPVIISNVSSTPEVVGPAGEYFSPADVGDMLCAIERVVYSDDRILELKSLGQERIKFFTWEKTAQKTLEVYRRLM